MIDKPDKREDQNLYYEKFFWIEIKIKEKGGKSSIFKKTIFIP